MLLKETRSGRLTPLIDSSFRHQRLLYGIPLSALAAESGISTRRLSLAERNTVALRPDEERRRDEALRRLAESAR